MLVGYFGFEGSGYVLGGVNIAQYNVGLCYLNCQRQLNTDFPVCSINTAFCIMAARDVPIVSWSLCKVKTNRKSRTLYVLLQPLCPSLSRNSS
jgi:hypothetical protein